MQINTTVTNATKSIKWIMVENKDPRLIYNNLDTIAGKSQVRYICGQMEKGATGNEHFQGYIQLRQSQRRSWLKNHISKTAHFEPQRGTNDQAVTYTKKRQTRVAIWKECGTYAKGSGSRTDIGRLYELAKDKNMSLQAIAEEMPSTYMKYWKAVAHVRNLPALTAPWIRHNLKVTVLYGPPDTAKTTWAYDKFPDLYAVPVGKNLWWDNYHGEDTVLMDDFSGQMRLVDLLRVLDKFPVMVPIKGSFVYLQCTNIVITTNVPLSDWYDYTQRKDSWIALNRRVHEYLACRKEGSVYIREPITRD